MTDNDTTQPAEPLNKQRAEMLKGREVRRQPAAGIEMRADDSDGMLKIAGYASVTNTPYDMGFYREQVARGAFAKTLSENPDVQLLVNHEGLPLARTTNGSLTLREDDKGLHFEARLDPNDPDAQQLARKIQSGLMDQASFAFRVTRQDWDEDYENRTIQEVSLDRGDVSVCNYGASPTTHVTMRSFVDGLDEAAKEELRKLVVADEDDEADTVEVRPVQDLEVFRARAFALRLKQQQ